jgi:hypothetical protein
MTPIRFIDERKNDFKSKSLEMDIFKNINQSIKSIIGCIMMLEHNLLAYTSFDCNTDIIELPNMNVRTTINPKLEWFRSLCVTNDAYIFGFNKGIAKYSKSFKLLNTY